MERALVSDFRVDTPFEGIRTAGRTDRGIADEVFEKFGLNDSESERQRFMERYLHHLPDSLNANPGAVLPGILPLLKLLADRGDTVLSLLTGNYAAGAQMKLKHYALGEYFRSGGFGDHHACRNEVARQAVSAIRRELNLCISPQRMIVIGDTPADVECARAIEATAVAVATGTYSHEELQRHEPDHLFPDLAEPERFIARVLGEQDGGTNP